MSSVNGNESAVVYLCIDDDDDNIDDDVGDDDDDDDNYIKVHLIHKKVVRYRSHITHPSHTHMCGKHKTKLERFFNFQFVKLQIYQKAGVRCR